MTYRSVRLGEVVQLSPKLEPSDLPSSGIVAFLSMADVGENGTILDVQRRPVSEVTKGYTSFRNGDVLLAKITPCFENGKAALVEGLFSEVGFGSTEFHVLRPTDEIDARYLFRLISNARFRSLGRSRMTGSAGQKRLPTGFLKDLIVSLPSLTDQRSIAYILEKADHLCNKRELSISLVDSFLRSVFLEMFGDPATNPKKWPIGSIRDLVSSANYGTSTKASVAEGRYPILRMNNITFSGRIDLTSLKSSHSTQLITHDSPAFSRRP